MSERAAPFYCPYCGDEDLRPSEGGSGSPQAGPGRGPGGGAWECRACSRGFRLAFLGLLAPGATGPRSASDGGTP
ncbi:hypothetical protein ACIQU6_25495 [Streptomyces sp. NPDC090442]|uniref:hypothetical protein n=1 Tax=Streptomyces sp. NPDC090442 TaxID=3365962 RepID=UPI00380CA51B